MARVAAVLKAVATDAWRERQSLFSLGANNFVLTIAFFFREYLVGKMFYALIAAILLVPLSSDPLHRIPRERFEIWPLDNRERLRLRIFAPWLNPITWLIAGFAAWAAGWRNLFLAGSSLVLLIAVTFAGTLIPRAGRGSFWWIVPAFPTSLGQLMRKDVRQLLSTLDLWLAVILSVSFAAARFYEPDLPVEARTIMSILIVLALSTLAQTFFALDGRAGLTRYRLLPLAGWKVLLSKATVFFIVATALTVSASVASGCAFALVTLAFGMWASVNHRIPHSRWRFAASPSAKNSVGLVVFSIAVAVAMLRVTAWFLLPSAVAVAVSMVLAGRRFDIATR